jgi:hypothetical protein
LNIIESQLEVPGIPERLGAAFSAVRFRDPRDVLAFVLGRGARPAGRRARSAPPTTLTP